MQKLTDLESDGRVCCDRRDHPHRTVGRRRVLVWQGRRRRPVDVAVVGLVVHGGDCGGSDGAAGLSPVTAARLVQAASETGQAGAQRPEAVLQVRRLAT